MHVRFEEHFDPATLQRGRDYAARGQVISAERTDPHRLLARVSNGQGAVYEQRILLGEGPAQPFIRGVCTCPVGEDCKHVVAVLVFWKQRAPRPDELSPGLKLWLNRALEESAPPPPVLPPPDDYPAGVRERLLYILNTNNPRLEVALYKGQANPTGTGLNKTMRRYDIGQNLRSASPAKFLRPVDFELLGALSETGLWQLGYSYHTPPERLRPGRERVLGILKRLCETGRFLFDNTPEAVLDWSQDRPEVQLCWKLAPDGLQRLRFEDRRARPLEVHILDETAIWLDPEAAEIGALDQAITPSLRQLVETCPPLRAADAAMVSAALPEQLQGVKLNRPHTVRRTTREPGQRFARLALGLAEGPSWQRPWQAPPALPRLRLGFVYDGQEVGPGGAEPAFVEGDEMITLRRDRDWEADCAARLIETGALPAAMLDTARFAVSRSAGDLVFLDGDASGRAPGAGVSQAALRFSFQTVPRLREEGWEIDISPKWPFRLDPEPAVFSVTTERGSGPGFDGNDWFSLGFSAEIGGRKLDVAPLVAAFLEQMGTEASGDLPDAEALKALLAERPVYLDRGKGNYLALDFSPLAPLLFLFLKHHAELGALHPAEASAARIAEEALSGSPVRFADNAGILPLARKLEALSQARAFTPPVRLRAQLRAYQSFGAAWMASLLEAGFGGVLADDMGLGKTVQTLALLQARKEAGQTGPALLIVPTSLLYSWQTQAAQFAPDLRLLILHGPERADLRGAAGDADLVMTTYPLLARDSDWLAGQPWPLVILDEAQTLKNPASQTAKALREIPAEGRLALTGTPLENSLQDVWTLVDWVVPGLLGDRKRFQTVFRTPIEKHGDRAAQARLARRLRPFLLRRTKEEVAAELPPRTEILHRVDLSRAQQQLYETVRSAMDERVRSAIAARGLAAARITVLDALLKLRQVCCDPALVKSKAAALVTDSAKRTRLMGLLEELVAEGRRVLVFSQFVEMLRLIEADLTAAGIESLSLTGSTKDRAGLLQAFARGSAPVFLLSLKAGGVGLNLTEADTVILYDPWWNPAAERQAMDRAHRIGQTKPVFVHRLVAAGTVEEKILDMQQRKQALADALFDKAGGSDQVALDERTLIDLFAPLA